MIWQSAVQLGQLMAEDRIDLFIETLTGTAFELKVSPLETIMSIKSKIQQLEGIPVSQQHLIWQSQELDDDLSLQDYSIDDGTTLKLVLGMRGGPINTQRVIVEDRYPLLDMAEYLNAKREELRGSLSSGRPLTVLVFHDGDQVHMYTVMDSGDEASSPFAASPASNNSPKSLADEELEDGMAKRREENRLTHQKMAMLKRQMKSLNIAQKHKKTKDSQRSPPETASSNWISQSNQKLSTGGSQYDGHRPLHLPPISQDVPLVSQEQGSDISRECCNRTGHKNMNSPLPREGPTPSFLIQLAKRGAYGFPKPSEGPTSNVEGARASRKNSLEWPNLEWQRTVSEDGRHSRQHFPLPSYSVPERGLSTKASKWERRRLQQSNQHKGGKHGTPSMQHASHRSSSRMSDQLCNNDRPPDSLHGYAPPGVLPKISVNSGNLPNFASVPWLLSHAPVHFDSWLDGRPKTTPAQSNFSDPLNHLLRKGYTWVTGQSLHNISLLKDNSNASDHLHTPTKIPIGSGLFVTAASQTAATNQNAKWKAGPFTSPQFVNKERTPICQHPTIGLGALVATNFRGIGQGPGRGGDMAGQESLAKGTSKNTLKEGSRSPSGQILPPIKKKKKPNKRCSLCNRKTGLATSYTCRCGKNFCATHRYAEVHHCSYDYKEEGRRLLQQSNPLVTASKLPKI